MGLQRAHPVLLLVDPPSEESELVRAAMRGDAHAYEQLYLKCAPELMRWVSRVVLGSVDAEDIVQDTFVAAFTSLRKLRHHEVFRSWLRTIAMTHMRRRFRRQRLLQRLGFADVDLGDVESVMSSNAPPEIVAEMRDVATLLRALSADEALALSLRRIEGYGLEEIAEIMGISLATVKRRLARAEQHLAAMQEAQL